MNKELPEIIIKFILTFITGIIIIILLIKRFIYFRPSSNFIPNSEIYKPVYYKNLYGWLFKVPESKKIVLLCNGNKDNMSYQLHRIKALKNMGYSVLSFDYSGYGKSKGIPTEQQIYDDTSTMTAYLRKQYDQKNIILYGYSIGCAAVIYAARRYSIPTIILESPVPTIKILIENNFPILKFLSIFFTEFNCVDYLRGYKGKSLVLQCPTDEQIPYSSTIYIRQLCSQNIQMDGSYEEPIIPWKEIGDFIKINSI